MVFRDSRIVNVSPVFRATLILVLIIGFSFCMIGCSTANTGSTESEENESSLWLESQPDDKGTHEIGSNLTQEGSFQGVSFRYSGTWKLTGDDSKQSSEFTGIATLACDDDIDIAISTYTQGETKDLDTYLSLGMDVSPDIQVVDSNVKDGLSYWDAYYQAEEQGGEGGAPRCYFAACYDPESGHGYMITINVYPDAWTSHNYEVLRNFMDNVSYDPAKTNFDSAKDDVQEYQRTLTYGHLINTPPEESSFVQNYLTSFGTFDSIVVESSEDKYIELPPGNVPFIITFNNEDQLDIDLRLISEFSGWVIGSCFDDKGPQTVISWDKSGSGRDDALLLKVMATGNWKVDISPLNKIQPLVPGKIYDGDQVFYIDTDQLKSLRVTCYDGDSYFDYFRLLVVTPDGIPKEFSESGPFDVYVDMDTPQCVLKVSASGRWSIAWDTVAHADSSSSTEPEEEGPFDLDRGTLINKLSGLS